MEAWKELERSGLGAGGCIGSGVNAVEALKSRVRGGLIRLFYEPG